MRLKPQALSVFQPAPFIKTLFLTSCLPIFVGIICDVVLYLANGAHFPFLINKDHKGLENEGNFVVLLIQRAQDISYGIYSSFLHFITAMVVIHILNIVIQRFSDDHLLPNTDKTSFGSHADLKATRFKKISLIILSVFGYTLTYITLYYIYSFIGTRVEEANPLKTFQSLELNNNEQDLSRNMLTMQAPPRMLEEVISNNVQPSLKAGKKNCTTFPLGRVLGSLHLDASSVVFSKDETLLFASRSDYFGVTIVDISDWEDLRIVGEWVWNPQPREKVSLALSPDEKTLFASNMDYFAKIEFDSDLIKGYYASPSGILPKNLNIEFETSIAPLPDGTKVLVSGYGLQVLDVSKKKLVKQLKYDLPPPKEFNLSTLAVSGDSLFLLNGTLLNIYNISDFDNQKLISSFESENAPCSFVESKDGKILTLIGFERGTKKVVIERVDVSHLTAPLLVKTFRLNIESFSSLFGLNQSPKGTYLYFTIKEKETSGETKMMIFDTLSEKLLKDSQNLISKAKALLFSSSEKNAMAVFEKSILALELHWHAPNDRIFSISKETFAEIPTAPKSSNKILKEFSSSKGRFLLSVDEIDGSAGSRFTFTNVSRKSFPVEMTSFSGISNVKSLVIADNGKILSVSFQSRIIIYDISELKSINTLGSYASEPIFDAVFTSDGKTCFAMMSAKGAPSLLKVLDLSDPASIKEIDSFSFKAFLLASTKMVLTLSKDEKSLFMIDGFLYIFDVSARIVSRSKIRSKFIDDSNLLSQSVSPSPDGGILAVRREDLRFSNLLLFDATSLSLLSSLALPKLKAITKTPVGFSPDGQYVYVEGIHGGQSSLLVFNVSDPRSPLFQSAIQAEGFTQGPIDNFVVSDDRKIAYIASSSENKVYEVNLDVSHTVFLGTEGFRLGEKSSTDVMILRQNDNGDYVPLNKDYKFLKASLFSTKIVPERNSTESKFSLLPYWMTFQKESGTFIIEPKKQSDLKNYTLCTVFSTGLSRSSFDSISTDPGQIQALITTLIMIGYLDNDLYVTANFGSFDNFFLTNPDRDKVYKILKENYFETFTMFDVVPSLEVATSKKKLEVNSPSENSLKVEIAFVGSGIQFLKKKYGPLEPLITEDKTKLTIEGYFDDVGDALKNLVVNSEVKGADCEGTITIWDHLNPPIRKNLKNMVKYFELNEAPIVNPKEGFGVQSQIDSRVLYTGEYFSLVFLNNTFIDKHVTPDNLHFVLEMDNKERSPAPSWLTFNDLILKGTPPEEILHRSVNLVLTVQNEFKKIKVPITLNIRLSSKFILKLLLKYSPYILTALGLWVFANRIYNILRKNKYRHHQDFYISIGQEITSGNIYPIRFLGQEGEESALIWKNLLKEKKKKKGKEGEWDKSQIIEEIKEVVGKIPKKDLNLYHNGSNLSLKLIHQLVMNNLALWLIDSEEEKETKKIYEEEIDSRLMGLVKWGSDGCCQVNEPKLSDILKRSLNREEEGMEVGLINQRVINVDLLKDVMIAEAMDRQSIKTRKLFTHLIIKEEAQGNWIRRFLKKNLYDLQAAQEGKNMVYGVGYEIKNGVLHFSGAAEEMFCGKTIVLQIINRRQKILKEVWIHGVKEKSFSDGDKGELEAQGRSYIML